MAINTGAGSAEASIPLGEKGSVLDQSRYPARVDYPLQEYGSSRFMTGSRHPPPPPSLRPSSAPASSDTIPASKTSLLTGSNSGIGYFCAASCSPRSSSSSSGLLSPQPMGESLERRARRGAASATPSATVRLSIGAGQPVTGGRSAQHLWQPDGQFDSHLAASAGPSAAPAPRPRRSRRPTAARARSRTTTGRLRWSTTARASWWSRDAPTPELPTTGPRPLTPRPRGPRRVQSAGAAAPSNGTGNSQCSPTGSGCRSRGSCDPGCSAA